MTILTLVAAVARNGVVGNGREMPWRLPEDLAHFKRLTMGSPVVMGRRTWDSLPPKFRPLPGRRNIVVTRNAQWQAEGAERAASLEAALALAGDAPKVFVVGGGELYALALPLADELELTEIDEAFEGHTVFPPYRGSFEEVARELHRAAPPNEFEFAFVSYRRKRCG